MRPFRPLMVAVRRVFRSSHLLLVNTLSCGLLMGCGDLTMQAIERVTNDSQKQDWTRTRNMTIMGLAFGPLNHHWYRLLDKFLPGINVTTITKKIIGDQTVASPIFACTFFLGAGTLERQPLNQSWNEFTSKFWDVYKADWCFWPFLQAVNFRFVPSQFRVVYVSTATLCWNTFLSYSKYKEECLVDDAEDKKLLDEAKTSRTRLTDSQTYKPTTCVANS